MIRQLEKSGLAITLGTREGSALIAEKFRFKQRRRYRAAIYLYVRFICAATLCRDKVR